MKANELMINDWVFYIGDGEPKQTQVIEITSLRQVQLFDGEDLSSWFLVGEKYIEPIPLTTEILEKNGFVSKKGRFMQLGNFDNPPLILWHLVDEPILGHPKNQLEIHNGAENIHVSFMCHYVHELQHALKLCQIDKEIVLWQTKR